MSPGSTNQSSTELRAHAVSIVERLREAGHESYLAGGCVRDELLSIEPKDFDVATDAPPDRVAAIFERTREVGRAFGVMHVYENGGVTEVATFRVEADYTDRRRPDEVRFATAREDAARRDFTVNALFIDPLDTAERAGGRVIDFVGGVADLEARVIRAVGEADERLAEDDLRSLRAVRFASRLGFTIEASTRDAIVRHAGDLIGISRERIGDETRLMLAHPTRTRAVELLHELGLDASVLLLPRVKAVEGRLIGGLDAGASAVVGLASWCAERALAMSDGSLDAVPGRLASHAEETARTIRKALVLSNDESAALLGALRGVRVLLEEWPDLREASQKRAASSAWFDASMAIVRTGWGGASESIEGRVSELAARHGGLAPVPLVSGDDLIAAGLKPGPRFKAWLDDVYDLQLEGEVQTREAGLTRVKSWADGPNEI